MFFFHFLLVLFSIGSVASDVSYLNVSNEAVEICSCGLKALVNGSDSFFLKSPKYRSRPCLWEFHVQSSVSLVINCFIHAIRGILIGESECSTEGDSFSISIKGETETHCSPFHHFSKNIQGSKDEGYLVSMKLKRKERFESVGETFECSINGYFEDEDDISPEDEAMSGKEDSNHEPCGKVNFPLRRMSNGEIISPEEYPWMVPLSIEGAKLCGGLIIDKNWILTSAHCLDKAHWVKVYFGVREYGYSETTQTSQQFQIHSDYNFPHNDIALIKLSKSLNFNRYIRPVCLPSVDENGQYMGFGWSTMSGDEMSRYLRGVHLHQVSLEDCEKRYSYPNLGDNILCTSAKCQDESDREFSASSFGQMRDERFEVIGLGSFTSNACTFPTGFTKVLPYVPWIRSHIQNSTTSIHLLPLFDILDHGF